MFHRSLLKAQPLFRHKNIILLHNIEKGKRMDLLEILEIKKAIKSNKNVTKQTEFFIFSLLKAVI